MSKITTAPHASILASAIGLVGGFAPQPVHAADMVGTAVANLSSPYGTASSSKGSTTISFYLSVSGGTFGPVRFVGGILYNSNVFARYDLTGDYACGNGPRQPFPSQLNVRGYSGSINVTCPAGTTSAGGRIFVTIR